MPTRRELLADLLREEERTAKELAEATALRLRDVLDDLAHVQRSLGPRLKVRPAACRTCGFVFRDRRRLSTPSRCPKCRSERVAGPWLRVEG